MCQKIRYGVSIDERDDPHYLFTLSMKCWRCGGDNNLFPLLLCSQQLEAAEKRIATGRDSLSLEPEKWRLESFLDQFYEELEEELKHCESRSEAGLLCRIFCLDSDAIRIWERSHFKRRARSANTYRNSAVKRKQAPTAVTPENLSPAPARPVESHEETFPAATEDVADDFEDHDPPAFTKEPSITHSKTRFAVETSSNQSETAAAVSPAPEPAAVPIHFEIIDEFKEIINARAVSLDVFKNIEKPAEDEVEAEEASKDGLETEGANNTPAAAAGAKKEKGNYLDALVTAAAESTSIPSSECPSPSTDHSSTSEDGMLHLLA